MAQFVHPNDDFVAVVDQAFVVDDDLDLVPVEVPLLGVHLLDPESMVKRKLQVPPADQFGYCRLLWLTRPEWARFESRQRTRPKGGLATATESIRPVHGLDYEAARPAVKCAGTPIT